MAGDWIKMRADLREDPAVFAMAEALNIDELHVVGCLHSFWSWADKHAVDGRVDGASSRLVDKASGRKGFAQALAGVKWIVLLEGGGIEIPNFERHNGETAKERSLKNKRQARWRDGKATDAPSTKTSTEASTSPSTDASTREEKRREEEEKDLPQTTTAVPDPPPAPPAAPPSSSSSDPLHLRSIEITVLCRKRGALLTASDPRVRAWAGDGTSDGQLLTALEQAQKQRHDRGDASPINAGYLDSILAGVRSKTPVYDLEAIARATA